MAAAAPGEARRIFCILPPAALKLTWKRRWRGPMSASIRPEAALEIREGPPFLTVILGGSADGDKPAPGTRCAPAGRAAKDCS